MTGSVVSGRGQLRAALTAAADARLVVSVAVALILAVSQVYLLPAGTIDISLATFAVVAFAPVVLVAAGRGPDRMLFRTALVGVLVALLVVRLAAMVWSPDPRAGLPHVALLGQFLVTLALMAVVVRRNPGAVRHLHRLYWPWVLGEAALVVLFRLLPSVEDAFLHSVAGFFTGHNNIAALFSDNPNNVLDPAKSGGVFVNANVAAMFLGVNGLAALALSAVTGVRWVRLVAVAVLAAVPFTGSKAATVLVVALPAAAYGLYRMRRAEPAARRYLLSAAVAAGVAGVLVLALNQRFLGALAHTLFVRASIWQFGAEAFQDDPVLGLGYGGWDAGFARYADLHDIWRIFPPHNILLATWSVTGVVGVALVVAFFVLGFRTVLGRLRRAGGGDEEQFALYTGAALAWILVQGMGENTDIFGEIHLIPVVALLFAHLVQPVVEESKDHAESPDCRRHAAHAVSAVGDLHREPGPGTAELPAGVRDPRPGSGQLGS